MSGSDEVNYFKEKDPTLVPYVQRLQEVGFENWEHFDLIKKEDFTLIFGEKIGHVRRFEKVVHDHKMLTPAPRKPIPVKIVENSPKKKSRTSRKPKIDFDGPLKRKLRKLKKVMNSSSVQEMFKLSQTENPTEPWRTRKLYHRQRLENQVKPAKLKKWPNFVRPDTDTEAGRGSQSERDSVKVDSVEVWRRFLKSIRPYCSLVEESGIKEKLYEPPVPSQWVVISNYSPEELQLLNRAQFPPSNVADRQRIVARVMMFQKFYESSHTGEPSVDLQELFFNKDSTIYFNLSHLTSSYACEKEPKSRNQAKNDRASSKKIEGMIAAQYQKYFHKDESFEDLASLLQHPSTSVPREELKGTQVKLDSSGKEIILLLCKRRLNQMDCKKKFKDTIGQSTCKCKEVGYGIPALDANGKMKTLDEENGVVTALAKDCLRRSSLSEFSANKSILKIIEGKTKEFAETKTCMYDYERYRDGKTVKCEASYAESRPYDSRDHISRHCLMFVCVHPKPCGGVCGHYLRYDETHVLRHLNDKHGVKFEFSSTEQTKHTWKDSVPFFDMDEMVQLFGCSRRRPDRADPISSQLKGYRRSANRSRKEQVLTDYVFPKLKDRCATMYDQRFLNGEEEKDGKHRHSSNDHKNYCHRIQMD